MGDRERMELDHSQTPRSSKVRSKLLLAICAASVIFAVTGVASFGYRAGTRWRENRKDEAISCSNPIADFGVVSPHSSLKHTFVIHNKGTELATITNVHAECSSCTDAALQDHEIEPGSFVPLDATLKLDETAGTVSRMIWVTVDKRSRPIALELKAVVQ